MRQHYRTKGIFLKKEDRGEADQLFTIFTEDFGKVLILGKAIRKITSKLRSGAELFYFSEIEFIQGKTHKTLTDAIMIEKFKVIKEDFARLDLAYQISEALDFLVREEEPDPKLWRLLTEVFSRLNSPQLTTNNLQLIYYYFLWNILSLLGYMAEIYHCAACGKKLLPETLFFVPQEGGVVCWGCLAKIKKDKKQQQEEAGVNEKGRGAFGFWKEINVGTIKTLRIFLKEPAGRAEKLWMEEKDKKNLKDISEFYFVFLKEMLSATYGLI